MTDPISSFGRQFALDQAKTANSKAEKRPLASADTVANQGAAKSDSVELSLAAQLSSEPVFDRQKVDQIKQAIEQGQYAVDPKRVAEQFMAIERMIR